MKERQSSKLMRYVCLAIVIVLGIFSIIASGPRPQQNQAANFGTTQPVARINSEVIAKEISNEKATYSQDYMLGAVEIVGQCDKFLNTPKYLVNSVASEVKVSYQKLKIKYPQYNDSALNKYLSQLTSKVARVSDNVRYVDEQDAKLTNKDYRGSLQRLDEIGTLTPEIGALNNGISSGL